MIEIKVEMYVLSKGAGHDRVLCSTLDDAIEKGIKALTTEGASLC